MEKARPTPEVEPFVVQLLVVASAQRDEIVETFFTQS
jgi:hypothetical protein